jgi:hypothetical protein
VHVPLLLGFPLGCLKNIDISDGAVERLHKVIFRDTSSDDEDGNAPIKDLAQGGRPTLRRDRTVNHDNRRAPAIAYKAVATPVAVPPPLVPRRIVKEDKATDNQDKLLPTATPLIIRDPATKIHAISQFLLTSRTTKDNSIKDALAAKAAECEDLKRRLRETSRQLDESQRIANQLRSRFNAIDNRLQTLIGVRRSDQRRLSLDVQARQRAAVTLRDVAKRAQQQLAASAALFAESQEKTSAVFVKKLASSVKRTLQIIDADTDSSPPGKTRNKPRSA